MENSIPEKLLDHTSVAGYFGYEYNTDKMNFLEKTMVKFVAKDKAGKSNIYEKNIEKFAEEIQGE